jgi:predicted HTH transcriptional regulator
LVGHRDYEVEQSANIDVSPGDGITFTNPGELTPAMKKLVVVEENGRIIVSNQATDLRNVSLCDIFFGIKAMERAGTGLVDVTKLMTESSFMSNITPLFFVECLADLEKSISSKSTPEQLVGSLANRTPDEG